MAKFSYEVDHFLPKTGTTWRFLSESPLHIQNQGPNEKLKVPNNYDVAT